MIGQAAGTLGLEAIDPFVDGLDAHAKGRGYGRRRLFLGHHPAHQFGSTMQCQTGILVDVHSVPLGY
jgi:hypothetical protein